MKRVRPEGGRRMTSRVSWGGRGEVGGRGGGRRLCGPHQELA